MTRIKLVRTPEDARAVYELAYKFIDWLRLRYPEMASEIDDYLHHQKFDEQIRDALVHFNPPNRECLLALEAEEPVGIFDA